MEAIGALLKACRIRRKINQDDLAHRLHTTQSTISKIEKGKDPGFFMVYQWLTQTNAQDVFLALADNVDIMSIAQTILSSTAGLISTVLFKFGGVLQCISF